MYDPFENNENWVRVKPASRIDKFIGLLSAIIVILFIALVIIQINKQFNKYEVSRESFERIVLEMVRDDCLK